METLQGGLRGPGGRGVLVECRRGGGGGEREGGGGRGGTGGGGGDGELSAGGGCSDMCGAAGIRGMDEGSSHHLRIIGAMRFGPKHWAHLVRS